MENCKVAMQLEEVATVLRQNQMPQATINMTLAAMCGLPIQKVDPKSMYIRWTEDEPDMEEGVNKSDFWQASHLNTCRYLMNEPKWKPRNKG